MTRTLRMRSLAAMLVAAPAVAQDLTIATSVPSLGFPFFVHMENQLKAEAESLGGMGIDRIKHLFAGWCPLLADADTCVQRSLPRTDRR